MTRDEYNKLKAGARVKIVGDPMTGGLYARVRVRERAERTKRPRKEMTG